MPKTKKTTRKKVTSEKRTNTRVEENTFFTKVLKGAKRIFSSK